MEIAELTFLIPTILTIVLAIWNFSQQKKIEKLKGDIDKKLFVSKIQFEKEFAIYNEIWEKIIDLRKHVSSLRPMADFIGADLTYEETIKNRAISAEKSGNEVISTIEKNKPFYPISIHKELIEIIKIIRREIIQVAFADNRNMEYWSEGEKTIENLFSRIDAVCEAIRQRIMIN